MPFLKLSSIENSIFFLKSMVLCLEYICFQILGIYSIFNPNKTSDRGYTDLKFSKERVWEFTVKSFIQIF